MKKRGENKDQRGASQPALRVLLLKTPKTPSRILENARHLFSREIL